jgi:putative membrane protein insertion efficiency factor
VIRSALLLLIKGYRYLVSPWLGASCRFEPSCSTYALRAIERHGAFAGTALAGWRLLRCHPWCDGGCDPVPDRLPPLFTRWLGTPDPLITEPDVPGSVPPGTTGTDTRKTFE